MHFRDRQDAGQMLGRRVAAMASEWASADRPPLVLGLPRGGVVVAAEVAKAIQAPLDVLIVRKIGAPWQPELAVGALALIGCGIEVVLHQDAIDALGVSEDYMRREIEAETAEARRRFLLYRASRPPVNVRDRVVIVVDDGIATGATVKAALHAIRRRMPQRLILAVPVAPPEAIDDLRTEADAVVCLTNPSMFTSVGAAFRSFPQTSDEEVISLLRDGAGASSAA